MKAEFFYEPELEFGNGKHIDIKFGLMNYGPFDFDNSLAPKKIKLGIVGTPETIEGVAGWLEKCRAGVPANRVNALISSPLSRIRRRHAALR